MQFAGADERKLQLPERETQVLSLAAQGMTDKQIAQELGISQVTVGTYWRRILLRFGSRSRTEVVAKLAGNEARDRILAAQAQAEALQGEVQREASRRELFESIKEASLDFIGGEASFGATFARILTSVLKVTESDYGFIAEVRYEDDQPYLETRAITHAEGIGHAEFRNLNTLYGRVIKTEAAIISNDTLNDRYAIGLPEGLPRLHSFLGLPIMDGSRLVGVIAIANRPGGYDFEIIDYIEPLTATCGRLISAYRADAAWKEAEREIVASGHRLQVLMDNLASGVLFGDREGHVQFANPAFCDMFGLDCSPLEMIGSDCAANAAALAYQFTDAKGFTKRVEEIMASGTPVTGEMLDMRDGRVLSRDFVPISYNGEAQGYLWHFRDVTLKVRETKTLAAILDAVGDAVVVVDAEGMVSIWNQRATHLFGFSREEAVGHDLASLIVPEQSMKSYRAGMRTLIRGASDGDASVSVSALSRSGKEVPVCLSVTPIELGADRLFAAFLRPAA